MNRLIIFAMAVLILVSSLSAGTNQVPMATILDHHMKLNIEPSTKIALIEDSGLVICGQGWSLLHLADSATITSFKLDGREAAFQLITLSDTTTLSADLRAGLAGVELQPNVSLLFFQTKTADTFSFHIAFSAKFDDPVENVQFSREKVGNEVAGTILDQGAYLSSASAFYPQGAETMARFSLTADIPAAWEAIADGNPISSEIKGERKVQKFANPYSSDGYVFMAAPYVVRSTNVDSIKVATYFFEADSSLCEKYLAATADYIRMYQEMIGPYPFKQFTVAENFFPTGYGMPGWTLLGQTVLRLPFIITSSLGHEVLHNWWGNSVYVDYSRGNWCEAAAVYGADYHYKLLSSPDAARDYRKDILKEYLSYVNDGNDFPLRKFSSRSSAETRTIGYNKGMMLFHLIEQQIGEKPFFDAWKQIYRDYRGKAISWEEWIAIFQKTSGQDLGYIIPEWIDRDGAPQLGLDITSVKPAAESGKKIINLKVTQSATTPYRLTVPIRATGANATESTSVVLTSAEVTTEFVVPNEVTTVSVDPDYHLFRRLYPEEVEPIISAVLGVEKKGLVSSATDLTQLQSFAACGAALIEDSARIITEEKMATIPQDNSLIILNPKSFPDYLEKNIKVSADSVTVGGQTYALSGNTIVMAGKDWNGFGKYLVILTGDYASLPRIGELVPHYGKYSYLVFAGAKNVAKGQWPVTDSPLRKVLP